MKIRLLLPLSLCLLSSCSLSRHLEHTGADIERRFAESKIWAELPQRTISWQQALSIMRRNNAELIAARNAEAKAQRETLSVYTDLIPQVSYYGYANKTLRELSQTWSGDDLKQNLNVDFSIPTLTQVPYRVYASRARAFAASKSCEGLERELISKLYLSVRKTELAARQKALEAQQPPPAAESPTPGDEAADQAELAKLLGDYSARWRILPESMPHISLRDYEDKLSKLDPLIVCQFALKLEQARLAQYGVALQYLPTINTSIYSPSLFSSTGGTYSGTFLSSTDTRLNLSLSYTLDTQLTQWDRYCDSRDKYKATQKEVQADILTHRNNLHRLRRSLADYRVWHNYMSKRADHLRSAPAETGAAFLERQKELQSIRQELLTQETALLESEAALVLEYGMPVS
ncbi:MAG: hypothetical protein ACI4O9_06020 [Akkermansia sp.]